MAAVDARWTACAAVSEYDAARGGARHPAHRQQQHGQRHQADLGEPGHDPRDFTLVAFGGGGGMHACALAKELGIKKVVIPRQSGVFSAWGMLLSDLRRDYLLTQIEDTTAPDAARCINETLAQLEEKAYQEFEAENIDRSRVHFQRYGRCRYQNQEHSIEIDLPDGEITRERMAEILEHFHANYEREYTYRLDRAGRAGDLSSRRDR